ncbi:unnamed protein product [Mycena citricolor]|uniref:Uncharacterized protein n=1 Tax=Mycena citricolor TaxID=2018698 RepID=A0AAD2GUG8_9AGAR|nr:unnamed protein product [Mycena citricolor]
MAGQYPLAALTVFFTVSLSIPAVLAIQRLHRGVSIEKPASHPFPTASPSSPCVVLSSLLRAVIELATLRRLPSEEDRHVTEDRDEPLSYDDDDESEVEVDENVDCTRAAGPSNDTAAAPAPVRGSLGRRRPLQDATPPPPREFAIDWDDVWPAWTRDPRSSRTRLVYDTYFDAFRSTVVHPVRPSCGESGADADEGMLEAIMQLDDDELVSAFRSLSLSSDDRGDDDDCAGSPSATLSLPEDLVVGPPAGLSPFCPPPVSIPCPEQPASAWRLDWY